MLQPSPWNFIGPPASSKLKTSSRHEVQVEEEEEGGQLTQTCETFLKLRLSYFDTRNWELNSLKSAPRRKKRNEKRTLNKQNADKWNATYDDDVSTYLLTTKIILGQICKPLPKIRFRPDSTQVSEQQQEQRSTSKHKLSLTQWQEKKKEWLAPTTSCNQRNG